MTPVDGIPLPGCRHDVLGHALKAVGVLRALAECATPDARDPSAEGWWDPDTATFRIRSNRYPDADSLTKFFTEKYRPTPIIAAWNKSGGVTDKIEVTITGSAEALRAFTETNVDALKALGLTPKTAKNQLEKGKPLAWSSESSVLAEVRDLASGASLVVSVRANVTAPAAALRKFVEERAERLQGCGLPKDLKVSKSGKLEFSIPCDSLGELQGLLASADLPHATTRKESAKKDGTLPAIARLLKGDSAFSACLALAHEWVDALQAPNALPATMLAYREKLPEGIVETIDSLSAFHLESQNNNPLFINRGQQGNTDIFRMFWESFLAYRKHPEAFARAGLFAERLVSDRTQIPHQAKSIAHAKRRNGATKGKGAPYFPDAIKGYNQGLEWVVETYPFCPLDYLLAVEGALAMRGAVSKSLGSHSRSYAAFPFVFEGTETMTDDEGEIAGLGVSVWLPIWSRPTTFGELHSFILDAQARLPKKDCRFASDFARAVRSQGIDGGFTAFQEFRFKMKGARIPWAVSGRFLECCSTTLTSLLNDLLGPVDEFGFLEQFRFRSPKEVKRSKKPDLHSLRVPILEAIESATAEPSGSKILDVLSRLAELNTQLAKSKSLREKVGTGRVVFVPPLRCEDSSGIFTELEGDHEFEIARAVASIRGRERQRDGKYSNAEPFLGSLAPLQRGQEAWFLPDPRSPQAVWSGIDLPRDLSAVLARRVIDSEPDVRPALVGACSARLTSILAFLKGELDDRRIARLVEALSLVDWKPSSVPRRTDSPQEVNEEPPEAVPVAYAAVRSLVEIACDVRPSEVENTAAPTPRVSVQRTVSLVSSQEPGMVAAGICEALRRLAIVGVPNTYDEDSRRQKPTLAGRDVVALDPQRSQLHCHPVLAQRLAAAALIPLDRRDRWRLFRAVTLPQTT